MANSEYSRRPVLADDEAVEHLPRYMNLDTMNEQEIRSLVMRNFGLRLENKKVAELRSDVRRLITTHQHGRGRN